MTFPHYCSDVSTSAHNCCETSCNTELPLVVHDVRAPLPMPASLLAALAEASDDTLCRPLHVAATARAVHALYELLWADIESEDDQRSTPLLAATLFKRVDAVLALIALGADVDRTYREEMTGWTPLMVSVGYRRTAITEALLRAGVDVNYQCTGGGDFKGHTALILVPEGNHGGAVCMEMLQLLLHWGADPNVAGANGRTAATAVQERPWWNPDRECFTPAEESAMLQLLRVTGQ